MNSLLQLSDFQVHASFTFGQRAEIQGFCRAEGSRQLARVNDHAKRVDSREQSQAHCQEKEINCRGTIPKNLHSFDSESIRI